MTYEKDDRVTYPLLPEWGTGIVEEVIGDVIVARFVVDGQPYRSEFAEAELQPAPKVTHA